MYTQANTMYLWCLSLLIRFETNNLPINQLSGGLLNAKMLPSLNFWMRSCCLGCHMYPTALLPTCDSSEIVGRDCSDVRWLTPLEKHVWRKLLTVEFVVGYFHPRFFFFLFSTALTNRCGPRDDVVCVYACVFRVPLLGELPADH